MSRGNFVIDLSKLALITYDVDGTTPLFIKNAAGVTLVDLSA